MPGHFIFQRGHCCIGVLGFQPWITAVFAVLCSWMWVHMKRLQPNKHVYQQDQRWGVCQAETCLTEPIPFPRPTDDSRLPSAFDILPLWWMFAIWTRCPCTFIRPSAGRLIGRASGTSIPCLPTRDKTTVPCHRAGDKTGLLFTDHTSTLYHLTPGSSKACWVDDMWKDGSL